MSKKEKTVNPKKPVQGEAITLPAVRCPLCGGEMTCRTSERLEVPLYDQQACKTYSARVRRYMVCADGACLGRRVVNVPAGTEIV